MKVEIDGYIYSVTWQHSNYGQGKGGQSLCSMVVFQGGSTHGLEYVGGAFCSNADQFNKKIGRKLSFARAVSKLKDKSIRTALWQYYLGERSNLWHYKGNNYKLLRETQHKDETGTWRKSVAYTPITGPNKGKIFTRYTEDFAAKFTKINSPLTTHVFKL